MNAEADRIARLYAPIGIMKKMAVFLAVLADAQVNTWTELSPAGSLPTARHKQAMAYSQADDSLYLYGGHNGGSSCFDDLQQYNRSANTWSELSPGGSPPSARCDHDMVWSDADEAIYLFGGYINESTSNVNDLYRYSPSANAWALMSPGGSPPSARVTFGMAYSHAGDAIYVFAGYNYPAGRLDDFYRYSRSADSWALLAPSGSAPSARNSLGMACSHFDDRCYVFGGYAGASSPYLGDFYQYDHSASRWTELSPNGTLPSPRFEHTMVWSQADAAIYVFGGFEDGGVLNDLHRYEPLENEWNLLSPGGSVPPVRYQHSMVSAGVLYMFGGSSWSSGGWKNDLYIYEPQTITTTTQTGTTQTTTTSTSSKSSSETVTTSSTTTQTGTTQTTTSTSSKSSSETVTTSSTTSTSSKSSSEATTTTTSSTSSSEGQLSCEEGQDVCAAVSFQDGARILKDVCFSAPCPVLCESATARKCNGPQGEEFCLPIADDCPLVCGPGEVECYLENFDATGQRQEDSLQCVLQTELPCPCGRNALSCVDSRLGASCVAATEDCPTSCDSTSRLCLSASFTPEGAFQELQTQCSDRSQPCACGENAKPCSWTDTDGLKRDECFPTATNCPLTCSKVCSIADYNRSTGELLGVRQTCANESDACPCGDFAFRCQDVCVPGNFPCPPTCSSEEQLCVRPSFDDQGEHLATERVCAPQGGSCGCGQGAFECTHEDGSSECLPTFGGHCPAYCPGGVQCPLVTNFHPDGAEIGQWPPSGECANTTRQCPCGSEAKWCESIGCIFKDADCPVLCTEQQKLCSLVDYTSEGIFLSYREICIDADVQCPCGLNTWRCPGSDLCLLPSQMAICPCASWQKACEITDYSRTGIPESGTMVLCINPELQCPCGKNALSCPDPMDSSRTICVPKASGVVANECPQWCSAEQLRAGNETCTQIFLGDSDASVFKRTSCRTPGDCKPGLNTKACPSGAFLPVWQPCPLGEVTEGTVKQNRAVEVAKVFWQLKTLSPNWAVSLTTAAVRLQFALAIPSTMETSLVLLPGSVLMFQLVGEGQSEEGRRLQGASSPDAGSIPRGPKEFAVLIRMQVQQGNPHATEAIDLIGELDDRVGASIEISTNFIQIDGGETTAQPTSSFGPDGEEVTSEDVIFLVLVTVALIVLCCSICLTAGICFIYHRRHSFKRVLAEAMQPSQDRAPEEPPTAWQVQAQGVRRTARQADPTDPPELRAEARTAMFSARFNRKNKDTEMKFRAVCKLLRKRDLKILMVDAGAGDDFGMLTARYLQQLKDENGLMLAVCTSDYAEKTASPYSSFAELVFAMDNHIEVLPLRVEEIYPPQPPSGEDHPFDKHGDAKGIVSMVMKSSVVFLDCRNKTEEQIADEIEAKLRTTSPKQGHGAG